MHAATSFVPPAVKEDPRLLSPVIIGPMPEKSGAARDGARESKDNWIFKLGRYLLSVTWLIYVVVLLVGLFGFWKAFQPTRIEGTLNELKNGGHISLLQSSVWVPALLLSVATTLVTVSVFELLKKLLETFLDFIAARMAFNQFWGDKASKHGADGVILLKEENIEEATKKLLSGTSVLFDKSHVGEDYNRFFKARIWVNKFDVEAAKHIRAVFWNLGYQPPEMQNNDSIPASAPFVVSVGLFSDKTKDFVREYSGVKKLIEIIQTEKDGDAVQIRGADAETAAFSQVRSEPVVLIPSSWDRKDWIAGKSTYDTAIILRHTKQLTTGTGSSRLIQFVVAGFTEHGTEAAGKYLGANWRDLHDRFWRTRLRGREGDFFLVITGKLNSTDKWSEDHRFTLTPQKMEEMHVNLTPGDSRDSANKA
jgi:hypothetical protein